MSHIAEHSAKKSFGISRALSLSNFNAIPNIVAAYYFIAGFFCISLSAIAAHYTKIEPTDDSLSLRVFALGCLLAAAVGLAGWLVGLLFGIPRYLSRPLAVMVDPGQNAANSQIVDASAGLAKGSYRTNTNLEDVSDWLTKTLIGVGLTQLFTFPQFLWHTAHVFNVNGFGWNPYGQLYALSIMVFAGSGGFWLGYVATRTSLTRLFESVEDIEEQAIEIALDAEQLKLDLRGKKIIPSSNQDVMNADKFLLKTSLLKLKTDRQLAAWGCANARSGEIEKAIAALEEAVDANPFDAAYRNALASVYQAAGRIDDAKRISSSTRQTELDMLFALYDEDNKGYKYAISIGEELAKADTKNSNLNVRVWLACAYGQQYKAAKSAQDKVLMAESKEHVLKEIREAMAIDPSARDLFISIWHAPDRAFDNDLNGFAKDDPDLNALLKPIESK